MTGTTRTGTGLMTAALIYMITSSSPATTASAFVILGPLSGPMARHSCQRRRTSACDDRRSTCNNPYFSFFSGFLPTTERAQHRQPAATSSAAITTTAVYHSAIGAADSSSSSSSSSSGSSRRYGRRNSRCPSMRRAAVGGRSATAAGIEGQRWRGPPRLTTSPSSSSLMMMAGGGEGQEGGSAEAGSGSRRQGRVEVEPGLLRLFNTEGRVKQPFRPQDRRQFYSCGPTVYDMAHIGNFRAFLTYDVLKRWLVYQGFEVDHVCNLTDVDDKIITRMARDGVSLKDLTGKYAKLFFDDLESLNIIPASRYPRATEHIDDIVEMIQGLMDKELAYEVNGSVYFRVSKHSKYGTLASLDRSGMEATGEGGGISDATEYESEKENAKDFALWKAYKPEDGDVFWETPVGKGRPGWHIECSAMARRYLGDTLDVHAGGIDLVFPHHENEVAQSEGFTASWRFCSLGKPFCGCWVHNAFVNVDGEKMSKSKGNFLTLKGTLATALDVRAFRYLVVSSQYRTTLGFSTKSLEGAKNTVRRLDKLRVSSAAAAVAGGEGGEAGEVSPELLEVVPNSLEGFDAGMNDDLNTPRAAASLFAVVKAGETALKRARSVSGSSGDPATGGAVDDASQPSLPRADAEYLLSALDRMDSVLGIFYEPAGYEAARNADGGGGGESAGDGGGLPEIMAELMAKRLAARESKDWATADAVRDEIKALGYAVKDVKGKDPVVSRI
ncbi:unnamed protein product [Pylaiella littoralis]